MAAALRTDVPALLTSVNSERRTMANAVSARLKGDEYQHLFGWLHALELLMPQRFVTKLIVEDSKALSADDVTLLREDSAFWPDRYHQIKYHVDHRKGYSVGVLTRREKGETSLLQKWFRSWKALLLARPNRPLEIDIVSNWGWEVGDKLCGFVDGQGNALKEEFFTSTGNQKAAKLRTDLAKHVGATAAEFDQFARTLHFHFGYACWHVMAERASERMEHHGLKSDENALLIAIAIVRNWVIAGRQAITKAELEAVITQHDLWLPPEARPSVNIYLSTIKEQQFDIEPDYLLDWRSLFLGSPTLRGHEAIDPADWNGKMMPDLQALAMRIGSETKHRLVRARGLARLSAWFAFGHVFSDVAGYTIEVDQQGEFWQSDTPPSDDFTLSSNGPHGEALDAEGDSVAAVISVSGDAEVDVRRHLRHRNEKVQAVLFIRPTRNIDRHCLRDAGDAIALADKVKGAIRDFVKGHGAQRLLLYYFGPLSAACFIGHRLNAICREVQIMEWSNPDYIPSFTLTWP
jgi:hypothetical protein